MFLSLPQLVLDDLCRVVVYNFGGTNPNNHNYNNNNHHHHNNNNNNPSSPENILWDLYLQNSGMKRCVDVHFDEISFVFRRSEGEEVVMEPSPPTTSPPPTTPTTTSSSTPPTTPSPPMQTVAILTEAPSPTPPPTTSPPRTTDLTFVLFDFNFSQKLRNNSDNDMRYLLN